MVKWLFAISMVILAFNLSSCFMEYTYFEHQPTKELVKNINKNSFQKFKEFSNGGILFIPYFEKLTDSFPLPESFLMLYSLERDKTVFIHSANISGIKTGYEKSIEIQKIIVLNKEINNKGVYYANLPLFNLENVDPKIISNEDKIKLVIYYGFTENKEDIKEMTFNIVRVKSRDIAWPT